MLVVFDFLPIIRFILLFCSQVSKFTLNILRSSMIWNCTMNNFLVLRSSSQRNLFGVCIFVAICLLLGYVFEFRCTVPKYGRPTIYTDNKAVVCSIQTKEDAYIDEWVDYHLGIGFEVIYIYDNSVNYDLRNWGNKRFLDNVRVKHFPGFRKQLLAYKDCAKRAKKDGATWAAFFDIDEFLLLKKNENINEFLVEYGPSKGAIGINWLIVGTSNATKYEAKPVTLRFQHTDPQNGANVHIKTIARVKEIKKFNTPHCAIFIDKTTKTIDTNGYTINGPFNRNMTTDIAVLYHYRYKSKEEFIARKSDDSRSFGKKKLARYGPLPVGDTFDDSVWQVLKSRVPRYGLLEDIRIEQILSIYLRMFMQKICH